ncbi:NAD(P)-binding protein [Trichoderma chlorosporum]
MTAKKLVTVVGGTGAQGGSVVDHLLNKPQEYAIRAVTRSPESEAAEALAARGVEVVQAELTDIVALKAAFAGSYAIFAVTNFWGLFSEAQTESPEEKDIAILAAKAEEIETQMGITMVDAALATDSLRHYVWSSLADAYTITGGKSKPPHYESKAKVTPIYVPVTGEYILLQATPSDQPAACIGNARYNFGIFVEAVLAQPDMTRGGKTVSAAVERTALGGMLQSWAEAHNVKATYVQIPRDTFDSVFSMEAQEFTVGMEFWDMIRGKKWTDEDRPLSYSDLGVDVTAFKSVKDSFAELEL